MGFRRGPLLLFLLLSPSSTDEVSRCRDPKNVGKKDGGKFPRGKRTEGGAKGSAERERERERERENETEKLY